MKFFCAVLLASAAILATAQDAKEDYDNSPNYYDDFYDYDQLKEEGEKIEAELDKLNAESDSKVKAEIDKFREETQFKEENIEGNDDYQFEDNRDKPKEDKKDIPTDNDGSFAADDGIDAAIASDDEKRQQDAQADYALLWGDDSVAPLPVPEAEPEVEEKEILEETQKILDSDADAFEDEINKAIANAETFSDNKPDDEIIDETKKILEETDDSFNDDEIKIDDKANTRKTLEEENDDQLNIKSAAIEEQNPKIIDNIPIEKVFEDVPIENMVEEVDGKDKDSDVKEDENASNIVHDVIVEEEDTVEKVYADLNSDLDKLLDTLDKLSDDGTVSDEKLEEVFDKLDDHFLKDDGNNVEGSDELVNDSKENAEYKDVNFDKIIEDIINEDDMNVDDPNIDLTVQLHDEMNEPNPDDAFERDVESLPEVNAEPILYLDAIVDEPKNDESVENNDDNKTAENASVEAVEKSNNVPKEGTEATVDIDTLNSDELEGLVEQFATAYSDVLDVHSETFDQNVAPIHITLNVDNPEVVISPNYPSPYPTNNIIDWIFDGEGVGIEMNITDFLVNGALGDYLLVKPGGVDESGHDSIVFTYRLNSEKRFRFTDVDRLFVRFEARPGNWNIMRGFQFSVKMISPLPEEPEPIPEPEPVLAPPHSLHTIYLASAIPQFNDLNETFRLLLADMAESYIADNNIEQGLNTTAEVTQITSVSACPVSWPRYELCAAVTFGVSLSYEEEEEPMLDEDALEEMWNTYSTRDPFALRLRQMGIAEFEQPSSSVLTAWLVIASGVVISMAMLAFVLWRFSCFEDYTRMKTYSDTDSLHNEKRGLDLYPTPHQNLPPLYAENEYNWQDNEDTTRVDMGGFANKSYARNMYDFDSDEEVISQRDRTGAVTARDIYSGSVA